ncbi:hypothetical protein AB670_00035 [Chryseobacterium sp. MOF25P]|uniref:hypothetical protein n=1 Tax=unclassified Chryseobacterium TaxID=2593645 RepID=UPI000804F097|nr:MULTISPECIES: hypothetical protein [unclassified Chryseobacterium]OBW43506.1 hypothetical protein AB670_00035 [Chryseobacterium sp. MOF25P]OBW46720.1 hypothetical protein AB671_01216 [Chryseobacterium sp. BGARF1]
MDIKEIFIGNYVSIYNKAILVDDETISKLKIYESKDLKPINITDEWLINFGFSKEVETVDTSYYRLNTKNYKFEILIHKFKAEYLSVYDDKDELQEHFLEHTLKIHTLQNVFMKWVGEMLYKI